MFLKATFIAQTATFIAQKTTFITRKTTGNQQVNKNLMVTTRFCKNTNHSIMLTTGFSKKCSGSFFYKFRNRTFYKCPKSQKESQSLKVFL